MESNHSVLAKNPERTANVFSRLFFAYVLPVMWRGFKHDLQEEDLYEHLPQDESRLLCTTIKSAWQAEQHRKDGKEPSLFRAVRSVYGLKYAMLGLVLVFEESVKLVQPLFIGGLIRYFRYDHPLTTEQAYICAGGVAFCASMYALVHHLYFYYLQRMGMHCKIGCSALIFDKALRLSSGALHEVSVGHVINLLSTDVTRFDYAVMFGHYIVLSPVLAIAYGAVLWYVLGPACLAGFACVLCMMPLQAVFGRKMGQCRRDISARADKRIGVMSEILNGIRVIKMYAWESAFAQVADKCRKHELKAVRWYGLWQSFILGTFWASGRLMILCAVLAYVASGQHITAEKVFVAAALFNACRLPLTLFLPIGIQFMVELKVALARIQKFLVLEEHSRSQTLSSAKTDTLDVLSNGDTHKVKEMDVMIAPEDVHLKSAESNTIEDIDFEVCAGQLVAIIGPVGSGKSTVLASILEETNKTGGSVHVNGRVAYVPQEAWVFGGTVRQNIIFGLDYDHDRFEQATKACSLHKDLSAMPGGDLTVVGDRGVALSGGQKARVNMARAVYRQADIYLLDDPLSAVDTAVGRFLFERCIRKTLRSKAVVLVTHQLQHLRQADLVLLMRDGKVLAQGTLTDLQTRHPEQFAQVIAETENSYKTTSPRSNVRRQSSSTSSQPPLSPQILLNEDKHNPLEDSLAEKQNLLTQQSLTLSDSAWSLAIGEVDHVEPVSGEEERGVGSVPMSVYWQYVRAMAGKCHLALIFGVAILGQVMFNMGDFWLNLWSTASERESARLRDKTNSTEAGAPERSNTSADTAGPWMTDLDQDTYMYTYIALTLTVLFVSVIRTLWFRQASVHASRQLHQRMFESVVGAQVTFFDTNPVGRVLNRFSKDTNMMDEQLPFVLFDFISGSLLFLSVLIVVGAVNPLVFIPTFPLAFLFFAMRYFYLQTSRDVKRLEATTRSPVFSHISATLNGLTAIRAFKAESAVMRDFHNYQNTYTSAFSLLLSTTRWFAASIDWLVVLYISVVALIAVLGGPEQHISSGQIALMLMYSVQLTGFLSFIMRQSADLENGTRCRREQWVWSSCTRLRSVDSLDVGSSCGHMVSVERILGYAQLAPEETKEQKTQLATVGSDWPSRGLLQFEDVSLRYTEQAPFVLKHITCTIAPTWKVGIVGRTGAGKSSLLRALFRLTEPQGTITIDGVDTKTLPLAQLRNSLSIIPQDPVLFIGSLRNNLDPFDEFPEDKLWDALDQVQLKSAVQLMPQQLETAMQEGGVNLSVGQRQLVCLARALLRHTRILVIDEATANVDQNTDALIQSTLREQFRECTVLTIAHRLNTIVDSHALMVLDDGELIEYASPHELLSNENSLFHKLVTETGTANATLLHSMAAQAHQARTD